MQDDEIVVSEVHVDSDNIVKNENDPLLDLMPEALRSRLQDHCPATTLPTVGLQVWKAALVMSDFLLHRGRELLRGKGVVELGSGAGLCGIVAAAFADYVFCTDAWEEVLHLCQRNLGQNEDFYDALDCEAVSDEGQVFRLDKGTAGNADHERHLCMWGSCVLVAVVYDDCLTDCLFGLLLETVTKGSPDGLHCFGEKGEFYPRGP
ncbi:hypothetical protein HPB50_024794 [Hyalomma asiaticum]|uniref:Uncharacterized protein n=1 Tax=Hyalomma asiaticum TaxID=266040 RepID=A0ACB7T7U1_HYAAI|nr:hypothetical protein HPB50_024794 [Hyalomma asiaticum]